MELDKILNTASLTEEEKTILMVLKFIGNETYVSDDYLAPLTSLTKTDLVGNLEALEKTGYLSIEVNEKVPTESKYTVIM
ncbi:MAG: hypothetical protein L0K82_03320 [Pisciglobus halotolerans]|nr:hypothetical protein [Pisciglobus halotolerans]